MAPSLNAVPSVMRKSVESVRASITPAARPYLVNLSGLRGQKLASAASKSNSFLRLPQESEDARITGDTRSLNRRLLGLNLGGSLSGLAKPRLTA